MQGIPVMLNDFYSVMAGLVSASTAFALRRRTKMWLRATDAGMTGRA